MSESTHAASVASEDEFPMPLLEQLLLACLNKQDVKGVAAVIGAMAVRDPKRAEELRQTILLGCDVAMGRGDRG
jgi:hypothetical protein